MDPHRSERLAESIREELEEIIGYELEDPRIQGADVIEVLLSPDHKRALIRLKMHEGASEPDALEALEHARHYLRRQLSQRLGVYRVPDLHFEAAIPAALGERSPHLLRRIRRGRPRD